MKRCLLAALLSMASFIAHSQQPLLEHALPELVDNQHYEAIACITDSLHNRLYVIMRSKNTLHAIKINLPGFAVEAEITGNVSEDDAPESYYGGSIINDTLTFLYSGRRNKILVYSFLFTNQSFLNSTIQIENKKEKILNAFVWHNRLCFLKLIDTKNRAERHLQLNREREDGVFVTTDYLFKRNEQLEKRKNDDNFIGMTGSFVTDNYQVIDIPTIRKRYPGILNYTFMHVKQYLRDSMLIVTEDYDNATAVFKMNMMNSSSGTQFYTKEGMPGGADWTDCSSSFLFNNYLFQLKAGKGRLAVTIHNIADSTQKKTFAVSEEKNDFTYHGDFTSENYEPGFINLKKNDKILGDSKTFLARIRKNPVAIAAESVNNHIKITAGVLKIETMATGGAPAGPFGVSTPGTREYLSTTQLYFNASLDAATLNNTPTETSISNVYDKIDRMFEKIDEKINKYDFFQINGQDYFCYYNQRKNKVCIVKVE